jgi:hypothetical protein
VQSAVDIQGADAEMVANFNADAVTHVEQWFNPSIEMDILAVYKL